MNKYKKKYFIILIFIFINEAYFSIFFNNNKNKYIFTFWEPKESIPGYLSLCIKTWKKFLPEYKIIIFN